MIKALIESGNLVARGRLKHQYPHSWRSKKPLIFRNTPQWFIALDACYPLAEVMSGTGSTLRSLALDEIARTGWVSLPRARPASRGMIANRPDWVVSRQRCLGRADRHLC